MNHENMLFVYPTDTVWGLGASIASPTAINKINQIKKITIKRPFSILFPTIAMIKDYFELPLLMSEEWIRDFFLMETTLILPVNLLTKTILPQVNNGLKGIGIRMIGSNDLDGIFKKIKCPLITTSLNLASFPAIITRDQAYDFYLEHCPLENFIESKQLVPHGLPSTIVEFSDGHFKILRQGDQFHRVRKFLAL